MTIAGYRYQTQHYRDHTGQPITTVRAVEGSHYNAGPQALSHTPEYRCPYCGGYTWDDFSQRYFNQHLACVQRARQLGTDWAWVSGESEPWPDARLKRGM